MRWHLRQKKGNKDNKFRHGLRGLHGFKRCIWYYFAGIGLVAAIALLIFAKTTESIDKKKKV